jgi:O-antigen/teichoic acid export membrane protein
MTGVRRAFLLASLGRYLMLTINLVATPIMARLLAPADYGIAVLGGSVLAVAEAIRALGGGAYLVQQKDLTPAQMHTNFTISVIATAILIPSLLLLAPQLAGLFGRPELEPYLGVAAVGFLAGPISYQVSALMSRSLAFGRIAFVTAMRCHQCRCRHCAGAHGLRLYEPGLGSGALGTRRDGVLSVFLAQPVDLPPVPERMAHSHELQHP